MSLDTTYKKQPFSPVPLFGDSEIPAAYSPVSSGIRKKSYYPGSLGEDTGTVKSGTYRDIEKSGGLGYYRKSDNSGSFKDLKTLIKQKKISEVKYSKYTGHIIHTRHSGKAELAGHTRHASAGRSTTGRPERRTYTSAAGKKFKEIGFYKYAGFAAAVFIWSVIIASGKLDTFVLGINPVSSPGLYAGSGAENQIVINKASINLSFDSRDAKTLVFTLHKVSEGESLSKIAYKYGLSPLSLISLNKLKSMEDISPGKELLIPYTDGKRINSGETVKYPSDKLLKIPGSGDYFVIGYTEKGTQTEPFASGGSKVFSYPVSGKIITGFGESIDSITDIPYKSEGIEISGKRGEPVAASKEGRVILTGNHPSYGLYVIISHPGGWKSFYGHLNKIYAGINSYVEKGSVIGTVGTSGTARSPRLYFALIHDGKSVDPLDYLY